MSFAGHGEYPSGSAAPKRRQGGKLAPRPVEDNSGKHLGDDLTGDISQAKVAALELEGQPFVVDAQAMENRGLQVIDMNRVRDHIVRVVVGFSERNPCSDAAASQPHDKAARVMVAAVVHISQLALAVNGSSKLSTPYDQGVI